MIAMRLSWNPAAIWNPVNPVTSLTELLGTLARSDVMVVLNHPNIDLDPHYSRKKLLLQ